MNRNELLQKCKDLGIKGISSKTKPELIEILERYEPTQQQTVPSIKQNTSHFAMVLQQLKEHLPKDKVRKVCKQCNELGHGTVSVNCKINIENNNRLRQKIKKYILSQDCLEETSVDKHCEVLSDALNITPNCCKTLYSEIPAVELICGNADLSAYMNRLTQTATKCGECDRSMTTIQTNTNRVWKGIEICDTCWSKKTELRDLLWEQIHAYKPIKCIICEFEQTYKGERFHYDHLNMFDKDRSVCSMVHEGVGIEDICREIDKCQILCISCHHIVTDLERKYGFIRMKQALTRRLNQEEITHQCYEQVSAEYQKKYEETMLSVYEELRSYMNK